MGPLRTTIELLNMCYRYITLPKSPSDKLGGNLKKHQQLMFSAHSQLIDAFSFFFKQTSLK